MACFSVNSAEPWENIELLPIATHQMRSWRTCLLRERSMLDKCDNLKIDASNVGSWRDHPDELLERNISESRHSRHSWFHKVPQLSYNGQGCAGGTFHWPWIAMEGINSPPTINRQYITLSGDSFCIRIQDNATLKEVTFSITNCKLSTIIIQYGGTPLPQARIMLSAVWRVSRSEGAAKQDEMMHCTCGLCILDCNLRGAHRSGQ